MCLVAMASAVILMSNGGEGGNMPLSNRDVCGENDYRRKKWRGIEEAKRCSMYHHRGWHVWHQAKRRLPVS